MKKYILLIGFLIAGIKVEAKVLYLGAADDADYINMYNQLKNANTGKFADVKKLIDTSDIVAAINKNNSVNPQHLFDELCRFD